MPKAGELNLVVALQLQNAGARPLSGVLKGEERPDRVRRDDAGVGSQFQKAAVLVICVSEVRFHPATQVYEVRFQHFQWTLPGDFRSRGATPMEGVAPALLSPLHEWAVKETAEAREWVNRGTSGIHGTDRC